MALNHNTNICIKSEVNQKFLRLQTGTGDKHGLLQFSAADLFDPLAQIEVVKTDATDLVHLKSRYNNKYLVRWDPDSNWICGLADRPNDDQSSWSCTFFKPIIIQEDGETKKIQFQHVQLGHYLVLGASPYANYLYADRSKRDTFTVLDWDYSVLRFRNPRKVALRGDDNNYLGIYMMNGRPNLRYEIKDPKDPKAAHEIIPVTGTSSNAGFITIKSTYNGKFWRVDRDDSDKIVVDVKNPLTTNNVLPFFRFTMIDANTISFQSASNTNYLKRTHEGFSPNLIVAQMPNVIYSSKLVMVDLD